MFEKEAEEYIKKENLEWELECYRVSPINAVTNAFQAGAEYGYNKAKEEDKELKEENEKSNVLLSDIIEAFTSRSYNDDFEMAQAGREIYELFYGGKDPKEVFHNAEVPKCSRQLLKEAKDLIKNIIRVTWGEGWNYDLGWKVEAEKFLKECEE